jgi:aminopeptidase
MGIGKGITFDTGGISIKPSANMDKMRGDMGGAACTLATILTAANLRLPLHLKGLYRRMTNSFQAATILI